jgi:hypothetical protein
VVIIEDIGAVEGKVEEGEEGEEKKGEENRRKEKKKVGRQKGKWGMRGLSKLIFGQNGRKR